MKTDTTLQAADHNVHLAPVRGRDRIDVLDIIRGIAILGIFYMNIPFMAGPSFAGFFADVRVMGWSPADQTVWTIILTTWEGTQRGMLEFLFGAGLMVTAARAMQPDGPVAIADLYIRRNLWLLFFGLFDIYALIWPGDILHVYALCALALFPFRRMRPRWLITIGLVFATVGLIGGGVQYAKRASLQSTYLVAEAKQKQGKVLTKDEAKASAEWKKIEKKIATVDPEIKPHIAEETKARNGSFVDYAGFMWNTYSYIIQQGGLMFGIAEAFSAMLIGIALWKFGFIQGKRTTREYLFVLVIGYGLGMGARYIGALEWMTFRPIPKTFWFTNEYSRLAVSIGHIAAINLLIRGGFGRGLLAPFKAAGQMAFSLYFMEQIIGLYVMFSPIGLHLPGAQGWAHLALQATIVVAILLVFANMWMRFFVSGPFEWIWRSLAYGERQPFRRVGAARTEVLAT